MRKLLDKVKKISLPTIALRLPNVKMPKSKEPTLEDDVRTALDDYHIAEMIFQEVSPEFIDSAILHWKSMEERYRVLLRRAKGNMALTN